MDPIGISVVIPSYNPDAKLFERLVESLLQQTHADFEVLVVDDASPDAGYSMPDDPRFRLVRQASNAGPAAARNRGAAEARAPRLFFTDTDCELHPNALASAVEGLKDAPIVMGNTITRVRSCLGKAVALLGFPGGGILGFDKVWRVGPDGYTTSFSSCNLAFDKSVFEAMGRFDESFPVAGGEDTVLANQCVRAGHRIRYAPDQIVYHVEKDTLRGFLRWQLTRGRGNFHIKRKVPKVGGYLKLRIWTFSNAFRAAGLRYAIPVFVLLVLSVVYQVAGFYLEKRRFRAADADGPNGARP